MKRLVDLSRNMGNLSILETQRLLLRPLHPGDTTTLQRLLNDRGLADSMIDIPHPYTRRDAEHLVSWARSPVLRGSNYPFAIVPREAGLLQKPDTLCGYINLMVEQAHRRGEIGYWMGQVYRGQGYATEAARRVIRFGFEQSGLNRIYAYCFTTNRGSARVLEHCGMQHEATLRQDVTRSDGTVHDVAVYGLLQSDWVQPD